MIPEAKELLLRDVCKRLPYGVICEVEYKEDGHWQTADFTLSGIFDDAQGFFTRGGGSTYSYYYKPYLRPWSSRTKEEELYTDNHITMKMLGDYYASRHLDYCGLIDKGLALEAPEGMYDLPSPMAKTN